jgi:SNF2 family DNA or RNA helicase
MSNFSIDQFERFIHPTILERGKSLHEAGAVVKLKPKKSGGWRAKVENGKHVTYDVEVEMEGQVIQYSECDCPYDAGDICKHQVAAFFEIREEMALGQNLPVEIVSENKDMDQLYKKYLQYPLELQRIVKILALNYEPLMSNKLFNIYADITFKPSVPSIPPRTQSPILETLRKDGFLEKDSKGRILLRQEFSDVLARNTFRKDTEIGPISISVRRFAESEWWLGEKDRAIRAGRDARIAFYNNEVPVFIQKFTQFAESPHTKNAFDPFLPKNYDKAVLMEIPGTIRIFLLKTYINTLLILLQPWNDYCENLCKDNELFREYDEQETLMRLLGILAAFANQPVPSLEKMGPINLAFFNGWDQLRQNNPKAAKESFELALKTLRSQLRNPKALLMGLPAVLYIIAQLAEGEVGQYVKLRDLIKRQIKQGDALGHSHYYLDHVIQAQMNQRQEARAAMRGIVVPDSLNEVFFYLSAFWIDEGLIEPIKLISFASKLERNGYKYLAGELYAILARLEPNNDDWQNKRLQSGIKFPLINVFAKVENWQGALNAMLNIGGSKKASAASEGSTRLIWLVDFENKNIQPKEQTMGKKGWTSGRNVGIQRLMDNELSCMTDQDRRAVAGSVASDRYSGWGSQSYYLDTDTLFPKLVGHPLLFLMKSPDVAVQLLEEKPRLLVKNSKGGYEVSLSHQASGVGYLIHKESPTRYKLIQFTEEIAQLVKAIDGKSLFIPDQGQGQLKSVLENLTRYIDVETGASELAGNARQVEADSRICVHLLPVGDGFHLETYAKPLVTEPPYCKPGRGEAIVFGVLENEKVQTERDLSKEKKNLSALLTSLTILEKIKPVEGVYELDSAELCLELLMQLNPLVQENSIILEWPKGEKMRISKVAGLNQFSLRINSKQDWFEVSGQLQVDENLVIDMRQLIELSQKQQSQFIELSPGKFLALTEEFRRKLKEINAIMTPQKDGSFQLHPLAAPAIDDFSSLLEDVEIDQRFRESITKMKEAFGRNYTLPKNFKAELRPYQTEGYKWLCRLADWGVGACLADDMGLGKTIQALALVQRRSVDGPTLVVAPASVCRNWVKEIDRFTPKLKAILFGEGDRAGMIDKAGPGEVVITTYDLMTREADHFTKKDFATIILDEAQAIKNRSTKRSETAMKLKGGFKLITTGTPLENHLGELWNLFQFINPGLLGSSDGFNDRFAIPIERFQDDTRRDQLRRLIQPFMLRRRKSEVLKDLPEKTEIVLSVELSDEERAFYEAIRRKALEDLAKSKEDNSGARHLRILAEIMRMRRAACHPGMVDAALKKSSSAKLRLFAEVVEELLENGHKALVFSQFVDHLGLLEAHLKEQKISYQYLDGSTPLKTRQNRIDAFQAGEGDLFLISLKAGGVGLNLTAADYVIHMDPWWNPAVEDQATDRAHRIGQEKPVTVYRIVAQDTIEEKIIKLHDTKRDLADSLLSGTEMSARLSADELLELIQQR